MFLGMRTLVLGVRGAFWAREHGPRVLGYGGMEGGYARLFVSDLL